MKTIFKLSIVVAFLTFFVACNKDDSTEGTNNGSTLTAKVDGTDFTSLEASAGAVISNGVLALHGGDAAGNYISITIHSYNGVGTYVSGNGISNMNTMVYGTATNTTGWTSTMNIGSGTLDVTTDDGTIVEGTFSFTAPPGNSNSTGTKTITDGKFKIIK